MKQYLHTALGHIRNLRVMVLRGVRSPNKPLFLLALAELYSEEARENRFPLNNSLESAFQSVCKRFSAIKTAPLIEYPYYHLANDGMWTLKLRPGKEDIFHHYEQSANCRLTKSRLAETVEYATLTPEFDSCLRDPEDRIVIVRALTELVIEMTAQQRENRSPKPAFERLEMSLKTSDPGNPFVAYLNSLHRLNGTNENALAENQACNPLYSQIHVPHPVSDLILEELVKDGGRQIILTGHAGDGKSTIAVEVYKRLRSIPADQPLPERLKPREDLSPQKITILKDLSERRKAQDSELLADILGRKHRFLIVSNTGALLDLFRPHAPQCGVSEVQLESDLLTAISSETGRADLDIGTTTFVVFNLARIDNLEIALRIFERMVDPARWASCDTLPCRTSCPICLNVDLINHRREIVVQRLRLAYRRMFEYGTRLTLRQITEHFAYMLTSGLEEIDLADMRERNLKPLRAEFMFFNRFFGDDGKADHFPALELRAVKEVRRQRFGERPCPSWERKLWLKARDHRFDLGVPDCEEEFELLRQHGSGPGTDARPGLSPDQAREQVRRMLFFLYYFSGKELYYVDQFLNSPSLLRWCAWQSPGARLALTERATLEGRIFHVLQEHFTGVRLPEGSRDHDRQLYITLSRGKGEIRQSAQVVVAQINWSHELRLDLAPFPDAIGGTRTDLLLGGTGRLENARLVLTLPFLDYVLMRQVGEAGEVLQPAYIERLERFKARLQDLARENQSHVMLVRLKTDHTFRRQQYAVTDGKLEVSDAL